MSQRPRINATSEDWGCLVVLLGIFLLFFFSMLGDFFLDLIRVWRCV